MAKTEHYNFQKPAQDDFYDIDGYNKTIDAIDEKIHNREVEIKEGLKGTLKNPISVTEARLDKTWKPGWYICEFNSKIVYDDTNSTPYGFRPELSNA